MSAALPCHVLEFEVTPIGDQTLVHGVAPITPRDRLAMRANAPLEPKSGNAPPITACSTPTPATRSRCFEEESPCFCSPKTCARA